ncbi:MAG: zinc-ribbon domain-containing protein [Gammaproteobacteria bacterium]
MALIKCSECGREISDRATSCPGCGNPIGLDHATTIEQTSKRWKGWHSWGLRCFASVSRSPS